MRIVGKIIAVATAMALAACASAQPPEAPTDASFAWGCWVAKDEPGGRIQGFLRLLKDGPEGKVYQGYLHDVRGSDMIPMLHISLARDGSGATVVRSGETIAFIPAGTATGGGLQFKSATPGQRGSLSISGGNDRLSLEIRLGSSIRTFEGERDGCD
jgi:hypothetical protein